MSQITSLGVIYSNETLNKLQIQKPNEKITSLILSIWSSIDVKDSGPILAKILINYVSPKLEKENTTWDKLDEYHYGMSELLSCCVKGIHFGILTTNNVKKILDDCWYKYCGYDIIQYVLETNFFDTVSDNELSKFITDAISNNTKAVNEFNSGKEKAIGAIVGYVLKQVKADPALVKSMIETKLKLNK